jgi:hypothetical protein
MEGPTPRQQAGYLRRLLRRGELQVIDPRSGAPLPTSVEVDGPLVRLLPAFAGAAPAEPLQPGWPELLDRLRKVVSLQEAEELVCAVEAELALARTTQGEPARSYIPQST